MDVVKIDGKHLEVCSLVGTSKYATDYHVCVVVCKASEKKEIMEAIYNRLDSLFGKNKPVTISVHTDDMLPKFPKTEATVLSLNCKKRAHYERIEEYFETVPIQKYIELVEMIPRLNKNSKFYKAEGLAINNGGGETEDILLNFKGKTAEIYRSVICDESIVRLLKKWKYGEEFHFLELLKIEPFEPKNVERIHQELEIQTFPAGVKIPAFEYDNSYFYFSFFLLSAMKYIVREDGIVAYITLDYGKLMFQVKNFTEKEMVESGFSIR
uniref:FTH domain-containing protein n=1 Tax=Caenorhabditis tropicalis TaxID=1561998 RepID=A0A1I7SYE1_9PELO